MNNGVIIDSRAFDKRLAKVIKNTPKVSKRALIQTADYGKQIILQRTAKGIGYEGRFRRYSPQYAIRKKEGWKGFSGDPSGKVNLMVSGHMLRSMQTQADHKEGSIYFSNPSAAKLALGNNQTRPFFGFNNREKTKLVRFFRKRIKL